MEQYIEKIKANQISEINLSGRPLTYEQIKLLVTLLKDNSSVTVIYFINNHMSDAGVQELSEVIKVNKTLKTLHLIGNQEMLLNGMLSLSESLSLNQTLTNLSLNDNHINSASILALGQALAVNQTLVKLALQSNKIDGESVRALSEMLKVNNTLSTLDLKNNSIGDKGAEYLSNALYINKGLTDLDLRYNEIGVEGALALGKALKENTSLNTLDLNHNKIEDEGIKVISGGLEENRTLSCLLVTFNKINNVGLRSLYQALKINRTLTGLYFGGDGQIATQLTKAIEKSLQTNIASIKDVRNQTLVILLILLRHIKSPGAESQFPLEIWEMLLKQLDFPSRIKGYRTSEKLANFLIQKNVFAEFNERLKTQQSFRLLETHGAKVGESRFSFLVPFKRKLTLEIDAQLDEQAVFKKAKYN